jgi:hypothetical protein
VLPGTNADLEVQYSAADLISVESKNAVRVPISASQQYAIHQFKDFVGGNVSATVEWYGRSNLAPSSSTVYIQIFNHTLSEWVTLDSNDSADADADFGFLVHISDLGDYKLDNLISCRVYQQQMT